MTITLETITEDYLPKKDGIYLIKAIYTGNYPFKKPQFMEAKVTLSKDEKGNDKYSIDISNQRALEISTKPIR